MKYILPAIAMVLLTAVSCKKDKDFNSATVVDTGDITRGGCGYILVFDDGREQRPEYLPSAFQHDSLRVKAKIHYSEGTEVCRGRDTILKYLQNIIVDDIKREL